MGYTYRDEITALLPGGPGRTHSAASRADRREVVANLLKVLQALPLDVLGKLSQLSFLFLAPVSMMLQL
jgi:hypothetical protein